MEYYFGIKKNEIMPFVPIWIELEIIILIQVSQIKKDKCHNITYIWNLR